MHFIHSSVKCLSSITGAQPGKPGGKAPTFKEKPTVSQENGGKNLVIQCKCLANPKPVVTWYKDNKVLQETNRVKSRMSGTGEDFVMNLDILVRFLGILLSGLWKYHARLVRPGPISFRTSQKFLLLVLGQVQCIKLIQFCILYFD